MKLKDNATDEKLRGGYYTPKDLADFVVRWGLSSNIINNVLEPSCGDGIFLKSIKEIIQKEKIHLKCTAIELDEKEAQKSIDVVEKNDSFKVINSDFYKEYREGELPKFELIVGNPPYIRYQYLTEEQREEQSRILISNEMKSNKLINAWVSFTVACINLLSENGKIGFVIPAELLQVAYAEDLRKYLMTHLQKIEIITFKELVFPNVEQEVVILLGEKDTEHKEQHKIRILEFDNISDLLENYNKVNEPFQDIEMNTSKWIKYFLSSKQNELVKWVKGNDKFVQFKEVGKVDVGITTGNNDYFCVNKQAIDEYRMDEVITTDLGETIQVLRPLIARSVSIRGLKYTLEDMNYNVAKGAKAYLLAYPADVEKKQYPKGHLEYIEKGEREEQNTGYKCSIRKQWYSIPSVWVPDAFFLRRNHLYPKFILNTDIMAVSTDTMHRVKFNPRIDRQKALLAYYNSISFAFTELEARSYGGGVLEILPREVENIYLANIFSENSISQEKVEEVVSKLDRLIRDGKDIEEILDIMDKLILEDCLGVERDMILEFRGIWKRLQKRRLARGNAKTE